MKLSEAIRIGAKKKPQYFRGLYCAEGKSSCALGALHDATMGYHSRYTYEELYIMHPILQEKIPLIDERIVLPPNIKDRRLPIAHQITILNDSYRVTREEIANILEKAGY